MLAASLGSVAAPRDQGLLGAAVGGPVGPEARGPEEPGDGEEGVDERGCLERAADALLLACKLGYCHSVNIKNNADIEFGFWTFKIVFVQQIDKLF